MINNLAKGRRSIYNWKGKQIKIWYHFLLHIKHKLKKVPGISNKYLCTTTTLENF